MNLLNHIVEVKKDEIQKLKSCNAMSYFLDSEFYHKSCRDFKSAIFQPNKLSVIAEIKKGSPSRGIIKNNFSQTEIAQVYNNCNVNAISVLTDTNFFHGEISFLKDIAIFTKAPLLRKDFIIDEIQIHQAKALGADAVLLICEILEKEKISELPEAANSLGLDVLLELHSEEQLNKINFDLNRIIGINNRDLKTFVTTLETTVNIKKLLPDGIITISESGISSCEDLLKVKSLKIDAVLVGEYLMRSDNLEDSLTKLLECC
jgi:indole-3-glycerol phosphate synthase